LKKQIDNVSITATEIKKAKELWDLFVEQKSISDTIKMIKKGENCNSNCEPDDR